MTKLLNYVYGLILTVEDARQLELFNEINPDWNETAFFKNIYNAIDKLIEEKEEINIVSISEKFRANGLFDKQTIVKISSLTSNLPSDAFLNVKGILTTLKFEKSVKNAKNTANNIIELIQSENYSDSRFLDLLETGAKNVNIKENKSKDNVELIFDIVGNHNKVKNGEQMGVELGFSDLRNVVNLEPVDLMVIGGRPAMGKTAFGIETVKRLAKNGNKVAFFSLEMSSIQIMRRLVGNIAKVDTNKIKFGQCTDEEIQRIYKMQNIEYLNNIKIFEGSHNIRQITMSVNDMKIKGGIDVFVVDYLQKITPKKTGSRYEQVTGASNGLKFICQNLKVPCVALAQLSRDSSKMGKMPSLPDLRDSGEIEQDASIVSFLHRPEYYGEETTSNGNDSKNICEFIVAKNREGIIDIFEFMVNLTTSSFKGIDELDSIKNRILLNNESL